MILAPLVGDPAIGARFDPDAPKPSLVKLTCGTDVWIGELEVDADEKPVEAAVNWRTDFDSELDLFARPLRVGRVVTGTSIRYDEDKVCFVVREIARLA